MKLEIPAIILRDVQAVNERGSLRLAKLVAYVESQRPNVDRIRVRARARTNKIVDWERIDGRLYAVIGD